MEGSPIAALKRWHRSAAEEVAILDGDSIGTPWFEYPLQVGHSQLFHNDGKPDVV